MKILFKRLNKKPLLLGLIGFPLFLGGISACKKKDRLTNSTYSFSITPPASSVVKTESLTLTATGVSPSGTVEVDPSWTLSNNSLATLTPSIGRSVVFQPTALGDVVVTATFDGQTATSQIAIVTYKPSSNTFDVYNDNGLPSETGILSDIFVDGGLDIQEISSGYTPEGIRYQRTANALAGDWGITLDKAPSAARSKDLSTFSAGQLKFSLRLGRQMLGGETFRIDIGDTGATRSFTMVRGTDFSGLSTDWQEISIPLATSGTYSLLDFAHIKVPFAVVPTALGSALTFDIDAIRWEK